MFPKFVLVRQKYKAEKIDDIEKALRDTIHSCGYDLGKFNGKTVGITVGSRGISQIPLIARTIAQVVSENGGKPVIFAAMGSHGGGTAEGQIEVLESLGVTEQSVGTEIRTCGDSMLLGTAESGMPVYVNSLVSQFDSIIILNRIKQHTDLDDITESGLFKVMAIGMGNPQGAKNIHAEALNSGYGPAIREAGAVMLEKLPIVMGIAVTENWRHETNHIEAVLPENLLEAEKRILDNVKKSAVKLPVDTLDTLIIQEAGKNISGTCVDTKVIGRIMIAGQKEPESPKIRTIAVLDFTDESHGNSMGLGVVDLVTRRVFDKINIDATSLTGITSTCLLQAKIPCVAKNDFEAVNAAFNCTGLRDISSIRAAVIKNTNALEYIAVTENVYDEIKNNDCIEKVGGPFELEFDSSGVLVSEIF